MMERREKSEGEWDKEKIIQIYRKKEKKKNEMNVNGREAKQTFSKLSFSILLENI